MNHFRQTHKPKKTNWSEILMGLAFTLFVVGLLWGLPWAARHFGH